MSVKQRQTGLDVLRTLAIIFVILIHGIGFSIDGHDRILLGLDGFVRIYIRRICYMGVPIFLMLSGYLNSVKTDATKTYRKEFPRVLTPMLFWCVVIAVFECIRGNVNSVWEIGGVFAQILNYSIAQGRLWYMNMYLGLLVLMPWINKLWGALGKRDKQIFLCGLTLLSMISKSIGLISGGKVVVISSYFYAAAYIVWYLLGAYIRDYQPKFRKRNIFLLLQLILCLHTGFYLLRGYGINYNDIPGIASYWYDDPILLVEGLLLFLLLYDWRVTNKIAVKGTCLIAILSFDMYLNSYIFDLMAYDLWNPQYYKMPYYLVLAMSVLFSFFASAICAYARIGFSAVIKKAVGLKKKVL